MELGQWLLIVIYSSLCNNVLLSRLPGAYPEGEPGEGNKTLDRVRRALVLGVVVTAVLFVAELIVYPLLQWVLLPLGAAYLQLPLAALVTALLMMLVGQILPAWKEAAGNRYAWVIVASLLMVPSMQAAPAIISFGAAVASALGAGLGYLFALVVMAAIADRLETAPIPAPMRGTPILLVSTALVGMAFMGLIGLA